MGNTMKVVFALVALLALVAAEHPMPGKVVDLTDKNFKTFLNGERPAVVLFYATWCPHCKSFKPEYEKLAQAMGNDIIVGRVDGETYVTLADDYDISGYPTIKLLRADKQTLADANKQAEEYEGAMRESAVEQWLKSSTTASQGTIQRLEMKHLHPEIENIMSIQGRCYRTEKALYVGH